MYPGKHVVARAEHAAFIMAETGEGVTYAELERRSNRLAHLLRAIGLRHLDHYAIFMENKCSLRRVLCRRHSQRALLHLRELLPDGRGARLHRRQQPVERPDLVDGPALRGARRARKVP
jgi:non-ribosomal peptide synthetase component F